MNKWETDNTDYTDIHGLNHCKFVLSLSSVCYANIILKFNELEALYFKKMI
jgi:hypothetical protein